MSAGAAGEIQSLEEQSLEELENAVIEQAPHEAAILLSQRSTDEIVAVLQAVNPSIAQPVLEEIAEPRRNEILQAAPAAWSAQFQRNRAYPEESVGRLMEAPYAVFKPNETIGETTEQVREIVKTTFVTYGFIVDEAGKLLGVITMRDLLVNDPATRLDEIMLRDPFTLQATASIADAMKLTLTRHFPVYPVCDDDGILVGLVRGQILFEAQAFEISAQAGSMVGVEKEERLSTPWRRSFLSRHPWLQLNLLTAFVAAAVVGFFQGTLNEIVLLAVFLPVMSGQCGNTGCQSLAVTLRAITLGEFRAGRELQTLWKEGLLGLLNGGLVGISAGIGMLVYAWLQGRPDAWLLGVVVWLAMIGSCIVSGISGALVPLALRRLGADPATASSIFLTTATDVISMGLFLGLATILV